VLAGAGAEVVWANDGVGDERAALLVAPAAGYGVDEAEPVYFGWPVRVVVFTGWTMIVDVPDVVVATTVIVATSSSTTTG
jgi:hypothetical protein